jgi:putative transposase
VPPLHHHAGGVASLKFHLVWCPKYRRPVLVGEVADRLKSLIFQKAADLGATVHALEVMPDHVHLFVESRTEHSPAHLAAQFKGVTSHVLRAEFPHLRSRLPTLWSRSYFVASVGFGRRHEALHRDAVGAAVSATDLQVPAVSHAPSSRGAAQPG